MEQTFGAMLRELRRVAGLTQRELANRAKLDFSYISKLENDRLPPPAADTIVHLCNILEAPAEQLLALTGKLPSEVQQKVSSSSAAQEFLREAQLQNLTETDWHTLSDLLRNLKKEEQENS